MRTVLFLLALAACDGGRDITETGNPEMAMALRARSTAPEAVSVDGSPAPVAISGAWGSLGDLRFVQGAVCDAPGEVEIDVEAPGVADLAASAAFVVGFTAPAEDYCRVRVPLERADDVPDGAPAELLDHALVVTGTRADGAPFVISSRSGFEADVRSRGEPFPLDEAHDRLVLAFDAAGWFDGWSIDEVAPDGDGTVRIGEDDAAIDLFEAAVETSLELFEDADDDGALGETDPSLATSG